MYAAPRALHPRPARLTAVTSTLACLGRCTMGARGSSSDSEPGLDMVALAKKEMAMCQPRIKSPRLSAAAGAQATPGAHGSSNDAVDLLALARRPATSARSEEPVSPEKTGLQSPAKPAPKPAAKPASVTSVQSEPPRTQNKPKLIPACLPVPAKTVPTLLELAAEDLSQLLPEGSCPQCAAAHATTAEASCPPPLADGQLAFEAPQQPASDCAAALSFAADTSSPPGMQPSAARLAALAQSHTMDQLGKLVSSIVGEMTRTVRYAREGRRQVNATSTGSLIQTAAPSHPFMHAPLCLPLRLDISGWQARWDQQAACTADLLAKLDRLHASSASQACQTRGQLQVRWDGLQGGTACCACKSIHPQRDCRPGCLTGAGG